MEVGWHRVISGRHCRCSGWLVLLLEPKDAMREAETGRQRQREAERGRERQGETKRGI